MNTRYNKQRPLGESDAVRSEDFWHSVWKLIEGSSVDDVPPSKGEASLQPPRDYVQDADSHSVNSRF